jgi:hypothetical protein
MVLVAHPAEPRVMDLHCRSWTKLAQEQKLETIDRFIADAIGRSTSRNYVSFNRIRMKRCLESYYDEVVDDFDELCSQRLQVDLQALKTTFTTYAWSCVQ